MREISETSRLNDILIPSAQCSLLRTIGSRQPPFLVQWRTCHCPATPVRPGIFQDRDLDGRERRDEPDEANDGIDSLVRPACLSQEDYNPWSSFSGSPKTSRGRLYINEVVLAGSEEDGLLVTPPGLSLPVLCSVVPSAYSHGTRGSVAASRSLTSRMVQIISDQAFSRPLHVLTIMNTA